MDYSELVFIRHRLFITLLEFSTADLILKIYVPVIKNNSNMKPKFSLITILFSDSSFTCIYCFDC